MRAKHSLSICIIMLAQSMTSLWAAETSAVDTVTGEVLEVKDVEAYTYLRLKTKNGETWAAVDKAAVKKGAQVRIDDPMVMENFESKTLKKTFRTIVFGTLGGTSASMPGSTLPMMSVMPMATTAPVDLGPIKVAKASGANAYTVAEVVAQAATLKGKTVKISGKVVKYNPEIMGKNWIHLQDGSRSAAAAQPSDILVTSSASAKVGDVITVSGVVQTDKDFTAGYTYKVVLEDATLVRP